MCQKDRIHYHRMKELFFEMDDLGSKFISFPIIFILITFFHYAFVGMHLLFEASLFLFANERFKLNVQTLANKLIENKQIKIESNA